MVASIPLVPNAGWSLLLGIVLVALNGFFVAAEFALVKVRPTQLDPEAKAGGRRARRARHMLRHLDAYLSATQLGITLSSLALGWVGEPAFAWVVAPLVRRIPGASEAMVHSIALALAFLTITALHIVLGEQAPKAFAIRRARETALDISFPLHGFYLLTFPVIWLLNRASIGVLRMTGLKVAHGEGGPTEEEIRLLVASPSDLEITDAKRTLLKNVFDLSERVARQVMLPRADVIYLSTKRPVAENLGLARQSGHTRFPLCDGDLDKIVGLIHIKDLFRADEIPSDLTRIARPVQFVPETISLDRLLARMRSERIHLAAVVDEYGGVSGVVTLENVIEEIVGSIQDEFDTEKPELIAKGRGAYQISGAMLVVDLEEELDLELSDRDEDTIGGVVLSEIGRRPRVGDRVSLGPVQLEVLEVQGNRVKSLRLQLPTTETASAGSPA